MTSDLETTRIVRSWLREEDHASADRILDEALDMLDATPQFRPIGGRRIIAGMTSKATFGVAIAAAFALAVIGFNVVREPGPGVTPVATPTPIPTTVPTPTPELTPDENGDIWQTGSYEVGRHSATLSGVPFTFALQTSGWSSRVWHGMLEKGTPPNASSAWIGFQWGGTDVNDIDPCSGRSSGTTGPEIEDIAEAYTRIPGTEAVGPTDVTVDGRPGKLVVLNINDDIPCVTTQFTLDNSRTWPEALTSEISMWFVDVNGTRFSMHIDRTAPNPELEQEIRDIVESIRFE